MNIPRKQAASVEELSFYASPPHECSYLPEQQAVTLFADPDVNMTPALYSQLALHGFRRSGDYVYRPHCPACHACKPVRLPVNDFTPNRSQRRNWHQNADLTVAVTPAEFHQEQFDLYQRYIHNRHTGGGMDVNDPEQYMHFLTSPWCETEFIEFRAEEKLLAVAVADVLDTGLSAVYTFFDPKYQKRGLGTYALLWEIEAVRQRGLNWLYLGYWIAESPKMAYKANYRPLEVFGTGHWKQLKV